MTETIAESVTINCDCLGALEGNPETMCFSCLDAYGDAIIQTLDGADLGREVARIAGILSDRLHADPELAESVKEYFQTQSALLEQQKTN